MLAGSRGFDTTVSISFSFAALSPLNISFPYWMITHVTGCAAGTAT